VTADCALHPRELYPDCLIVFALSKLPTYRRERATRSKHAWRAKSCVVFRETRAFVTGLKFHWLVAFCFSSGDGRLRKQTDEVSQDLSTNVRYCLN
jgi:hypothetical protein